MDLFIVHICFLLFGVLSSFVCFFCFVLFLFCLFFLCLSMDCWELSLLMAVSLGR